MTLNCNVIDIIKEYEIENFKSISQKAKIPLKPITLIFGPNSSGKSAIIQSILMLKQTLMESSSKKTVLLSNGSLVDLGLYADFISNNDITKKLCVSITFNFPGNNKKYIPEPIKPDGFYDGIHCGYARLLEIINNYDNYKLDIKFHFNKAKLKVGIDSFSIFIDENSEACAVYSNDPKLDTSKFRIVEVNKNHSFFKLLIPSIFKIRLNIIIERREEHKEELNKSEETGYMPLHLWDSSKLDPIIDKMEKELRFELNESEYCEILSSYCDISDLDNVANFVPIYDFDENSYDLPILGKTEFMHYSHINHLTSSAGLCLESFLKSIVYLGPFRQLPERYYRVTGDMPSHVGRSGELMPQILHHDPEKLTKLNVLMARFEIPYELKVNRINYFDSQDHNDKNIKQSDIFVIRMLNKRNGTEASIRDVGFGYSQVLPIIMQAELSQKEFIIIEQPELHLHPAMQTELGDLFINSALGENKNKFLIETHSEHLILRILRRIRETTAGELPENVSPIHPEDIAVLYVEPGEDGSVVKEMKVDANGEFIDWWPAGFFTERADELF